MLDQESLLKTMKYSQQSRAKFEFSRFLALFVLLISSAQIAILYLPETEYRIWEYITADILLAALCCSNLIFIPKRDISLRVIWASCFLWFFGSLIYNTSLQFIFPETESLAISAAAVTGIFMLLFIYRFVWRWDAINPVMRDGMFYEIIGMPQNLPQNYLAMKTGFGGSFAITDNKVLWLYSNQTNDCVEIALPKNYVSGRLVLPICPVSTKKYKEVRVFVGLEYSLNNNCDDLHNLAQSWRGK